MTIPALSPQEPAKRSKHLYVYWGAALALLIAAGLVCWLVVVPVWRAKRAIERIRGEQEWDFGQPTSWVSGNLSPEIERLGGPEKAVDSLSLYLCFVHTDASHRLVTVAIMEECGALAVPTLGNLLKDEDPSVRQAAAEALKNIRAADKKEDARR